MERRLAAILVADVVGYSRLMGADEAGTFQRLKTLRRELVQPTIIEYKGRIVKLMGDGLLAEFPSVVEAVQCAVDIQMGMARSEPGLPEDRRIRLRIGVNLGDIIVEGDDISGDGVNVAARLEGLAEPGGICLSAKVHEEVKNRLELSYEDLGLKHVKNVTEPVHVFRVVNDVASVLGTPSAVEKLALPNKPSIAVLPFDNMSGDPEQEYFSDGVTEDIITELSGFQSIFVIARNSSFVYKGRARGIKQISQDLGVRYVLEGSVRKSASRVRITAQLIEAATGNHIWAQRYDRDLKDVFALQDEITTTIVAAIEPELESAERDRARRKLPDSLDAWESYQRGMWHACKMNSEDAVRAETHFREALVKAPRYASAMAGLAYIDFHRVILNYDINAGVEREDILDRALELASEAVQSDDRDAFAQFVLGRLLALNGDFDEAIERLTLAVELNPNSALAHHGLGYALAVGGRPAESEVEFATALRLSPKDQYRWAFSTMRAFSLMLLNDYEGAIEWGRKGIRDNAKMFWPYVQVASALGHLGRIEEAKRVVADLLQVKPDFSMPTIDQTVKLKYAADREHLLDGLRKAGLPD